MCEESEKRLILSVKSFDTILHDRISLAIKKEPKDSKYSGEQILYGLKSASKVKIIFDHNSDLSQFKKNLVETNC